MKIKVGIVEDDAFIRERLIILINQNEDFSCLHSFETAEEAIAKIPLLNLEVVLVDIQLPKINGIDCVSVLKPLCPNTQFLMCTCFEDTELIFKALQAGASGYLTKNTHTSKLYEAITDIYFGGAPMSSQIARKVVESFHENSHNNDKFQQLSAREKEILQLLSNGLKYKEIALQLFLSVETVRTHVSNIYEKLQVHSRTAAINKVFKK